MTTERMLGGFTRKEWLDYLGISTADDPKLAALASLTWGGHALHFLRVNATENGWELVAITGLTDGDKGDITVASSGTAWSIDNDAVTNAKLANMADTTLKGRAVGAGTGDPTDLTAAQAMAIIMSGGQLAFPATQNPSSDPNTLDDYEEGTWTPGVTFGGGSTGVTYGATNGANYIKIGRLVHVSGRLILTAKGSSTGAAALTGLPFAASVTNAASMPLGLYSAITTITAPLFVNLANGSTSAGIFTTPVTVVTDANFQNTTTINFNFCYRTTD